MTTFRLGGLLRVRKFEEDRAAVALAARTIERQEAEERVAAAQRALSDQDLDGSVGAQEWRLAALCRVAATSSLGDARTVRAQREKEHAEAKGQWSEARMRATSLGKLAEEHVRRERHEEARREQASLDEIAIRSATLREEGEPA
jgi:flagellar FliJ protein